MSRRRDLRGNPQGGRHRRRATALRGRGDHGGTDALGEVSVSVRANGRLAGDRRGDGPRGVSPCLRQSDLDALEGVAIREAEDATAESRRGAHTRSVTA